LRSSPRGRRTRRKPRHTTYFDDLAAALRACAKGLFRAEAAVELLIGHASWLRRPDFLEIAVEFGEGIVDGVVPAAVDWESAVAGLDTGRLPCSSGEGQMLRVAASIADEGVRLDLGSALSGLDERNVTLVATAVLHAAGHRGSGVRLAAGGGRW
jgi:hypothetical protein